MWVRTSEAVQRLAAGSVGETPHGFQNEGEVFGVRKLACAFGREASFALSERRQAAALQGACGAN